MRASFEGGLQGLYADNSITLLKKCMDNSLLEEMLSIESLISSGDLLGLVRSSG